MVAEILRQTGRDHPGVTMAEVEPSGSPDPYIVHMQVIAHALTHTVKWMRVAVCTKLQTWM